MPKGIYQRPSLSERLMAGVSPEPNSGCWLWTGAGNKYGVIQSGGKALMAHRVSWELRFGAIPDGMFVCHRCDNPICVNPDHLFLGLPADNSRDMVAKARQSRGLRHASAVRPTRGVRHHSAKLNEDVVRLLRKSGKPTRQIAQEYGVAQSTVHAMMRGRTWTHVGD